MKAIEEEPRALEHDFEWQQLEKYQSEANASKCMEKPCLERPFAKKN